MVTITIAALLLTAAWCIGAVIADPQDGLALGLVTSVVMWLLGIGLALLFL